MDIILRAVIIYVALLVIMRLSGKRTLSQITVFDFILLLIVGEATQQALLGDDFSITTSLTVIGTLVALDIILSIIKRKYPKIELWAEGAPLVILKDGKPIEKNMKKERIDVADVLSAARVNHGIERLDQIKYAVLEKSGGIAIIPKKQP